jgi:hypothetical protein
MWTDRRRSRITNYKRWASSHRLTLVAPLLITLFSRTVVSLSQTNFGSVVRDDLFGATASRHNANTDGSSRPAIESNGVAAGSIPQTDSGLESPPFRRGHWCEYCSVGFNKHKSYLEHVAGKRHKAVIAEGDLVWEEYLARGKDSVFWDASVTKMDVAKAWSLDAFAEGLRARGRSSKKKSVSRIGMVGTNDGLLSPPLHYIGNNGNIGGGNQIDPTLRLSDLPP